MIMIEIAFVLTVILAIPITAGLLIFNFFKNKNVQQVVEHSLNINTVKELENLLIVHDKELNKNIKQKIRVRIDDLIIEEDENKFKIKEYIK